MPGVVKRSVSLPAWVSKELEQEAEREGMGFSGALAQAAEQWLVVRRGLRAVQEWETANGVLTDAELADADAVLAAAGTADPQIEKVTRRQPARDRR
ncbi:MAG: hypothetical protein ACR2K2_15875 [Mycobacteriales bacterium]